MAVYRFRVSFEDYDDVTRVIDIKSNQTFEDLHYAIHKSTGYNPEFPSSFYISNDQWIKGEEITYLPNQKRIDRGIALMDKVKLLKYIDDPHQKFYYTFNFDRPFDFHVELLNIILEEAKGVTYPAVIKSTGEAPKQFINVVVAATEAATANDDFDFLNEMALNEDDTEDLSEVTDTLVDDTPIQKADSEDEDDEFGGGFDDEEEEFGMDDQLSNEDDY